MPADQTISQFFTLNMQTRLSPIGGSLKESPRPAKIILSMFISTKKSFTLLFTLLLAVVFLGTSCKKDDEKTTKDYLTAHDWKLVSTTFGGISTPLEDCDKDDITTFHEDGELHLDEGATKCDETDPQETIGSWSVSTSTDPETLSLTYDDGTGSVTEEYGITELTDNKMVLTIEDVPLVGTIVTTFEKI